jgi:Tfp pilus assembly protein PilO
MASLAPKLRRAVRRLGLPVIAATALAAAAVVVYLAGVQPMRSEVTALQAQANAAQQRLRSGNLERGAAPASVSEQLRSFHSFFPRADSLPHWLDTIHKIGRGAGLVIRSGEYRLERQDQGLWRYHVTLPVAGNYIQVRQFITFVLREVPAASLDDVQLRREPGAGERVEARLRFSLHLTGS